MRLDMVLAEELESSLRSRFSFGLRRTFVRMVLTLLINHYDKNK
jgi:hypothetical protein